MVGAEISQQQTRTDPVGCSLCVYHIITWVHHRYGIQAWVHGLCRGQENCMHACVLLLADDVDRSYSTLARLLRVLLHMPTTVPRVPHALLLIVAIYIFHSDAYMTSCIGGQRSRRDRPVPLTLMHPSYSQEGLFWIETCQSSQ